MLSYVVTADNSGHIIYSGLDTFTVNYSGMYGNLFFWKYDAAGTEIYNISIGGNAIVESIVAGNNNYFLTGKFKDVVSFPGHPELFTSRSSSEYFLAVFDYSGNVLSVNSLNTMFSGIADLSFMTIGSDNYLYLGMTIGNDSRICKMDNTGNIIQTFEQQSVWMINSIDFDPDGNVFVSSAFADTQCYFGGVLFEVSTQDNMYVAKYDSQGKILWVRFIEDVLYSSHNQIKCDMDGNVYFSGTLATGMQIGPFWANGPNWVFDIFLTKLDDNGDFRTICQL